MSPVHTAKLLSEVLSFTAFGYLLGGKFGHRKAALKFYSD